MSISIYPSSPVGSKNKCFQNILSDTEKGRNYVNDLISSSEPEPSADIKKKKLK